MRKPTVLVVDDEDPVRFTIREVLRRAGYRVIEATDGEDGVKKYRQRPTDVVIIDVFLPEKSGLEVIQELRREFTDIKIIAISGVDIRDGIELETITRSYGVHRTLRKPLVPGELVQAVKELAKRP